MLNSANPFITHNFLLQNVQAQTLYHDFASSMPIIDYHNHLPVKEIAGDRNFKNLTQLWLSDDHYKWRAMRTAGVNEKYITGEANDREKFMTWAETVPKTLGNPLYHWTHLELARYFGITCLLNADTASEIWEETRRQLKQSTYTARSLLKKMQVDVLCTTNDPVESLHYHKQIAEDTDFDILVLPAFRPDNAMNVKNIDSLNDWINRLEQCTELTISKYETYLEALQQRHNFFHDRGCRLSDHGIEKPYAKAYSYKNIGSIFDKIRSGNDLTDHEQAIFKSAMLHEFGLMDFKSGWVQQYHIGAVRSVNTRLVKQIGKAKGFDSIGDFPIAKPLGKMLDRLDQTNQLPKTILYNVNPSDNALMTTMIGNFQDGSIPGKMQFGSGWWFLDQKDGMEAQLQTLAHMGLLSEFIGMLTDSRSFLSYPRHEYFRRVLCNWLGDSIQKGLLPNDIQLIGSMIEDICYYNAQKYFGLKTINKRTNHC